MKCFDVRSVFVIAALALLTACGGSAPADLANEHTISAAVMVHGASPVADCEAEGCNQPRIVDGLAEQYRFGAVQQQQQQQQQPAQRAEAGALLAAGIVVDAATEAPSAAAAQAE